MNTDFDLIEVLNMVGLTEKEALVYVTLLELGESLPSSVARKSLLKRPTVYVILEQLKKKGLVSHVIKGKSLFYSPVDPTALVEDQARKLKNLEVILPEMLRLKHLYDITPQMSIFEGKEGIIQVMEDTLTTSGEILCWSNTDLAVNTLLKEYHPHYLAKKIQKKIWTRCLFLYDSVGLGFKLRASEELREVYFIPKDRFLFENEINIYDNKMSIISHKDNVGVILQNEAIANTQRSIFNFAFEYARLIEKDLLSTDDKKSIKKTSLKSS
ncbi:hypothetical protein IPG41_00925 [Candidatus Peregrinibacteria bacterium]|nr:MAG: hypothetical protein IPG41_00925 [Candidatus Peregrinibacteria bacterium]